VYQVEVIGEASAVIHFYPHLLFFRGVSARKHFSPCELKRRPLWGKRMISLLSGAQKHVQLFLKNLFDRG
jgi:hypothetical protein